MKTFMFLMIFLSSSMLAYSQNRADTTLYIEPITGGSPSDRTFFEENIRMEVGAAGYNVIDELVDAIYSISGSIMPEDDGNVLSITLGNVAESREMVTQELFYTQVEESYETLPFLVWQMMANAPFLVTEAPPPAPPPVIAAADPNANRMAPIVNLINAVPDDDTWKNKWIYLGAKFGPSLHFYKTGPDSFNTDADIQGFTVAAGLEASVQILDFLSAQAEANFSMDNADYRDLDDLARAAQVDHMYKSVYLDFPLLVKAVIKPGRTFLVEPYGGAYLNLNLGLSGNDMLISIGGWLAGAGIGFKVGAGVLFFDLRYAMDFLDTTVTGDYGALVEFRRHIATISAGYKIGFLNRKQSATRFRGARY
ncbi:MAG: PorT family protein [Treponema sp.]|jgi:hypothetical protein|nr:PorT family protein [Treponema sp.]